MATINAPARGGGVIHVSAGKLLTPSTVLFVIGLSSAFNFNLVGTVFAADVLLIISLPILLLRHGALARLRLGTPYLAFCGLWLVGTIVTDVVRQTQFENYIRGWAKIGFFTAAFIAILLLSEAKIRRLMVYFAGLAFAGIISATFFPNDYQRGVPWKFGYAIPIAILTVIAASLGKQPKLLRQALPPALMGAVNIALNFRSMFAMLIATSAVSALVWAARLVAPGRRLVSAAFALVFLALSVVGLGTGANVYGQLAVHGVLGIEAKEKYEQQTQAGLGVLLGGRTESLVSTRAIADSPILGHGSWAEDHDYVVMRLLLLRERGVVNKGEARSQLIPSHSYLLGSWVEAGIAGGIFWTFCWIMTLRSMMLLVDIRSAVTPFAAFMLAQLLWNIPFSPFGADVRFFVAGQLCVIIWAVKEARIGPPRPARIPPTPGHRTTHAG